MIFSDIKVKRMEAVDIPGVKAIEEKCRLSPWSNEDYLSEIDRRDSISLVARKRNLIVGFLISRLITAEPINPDLPMYLRTESNTNTPLNIEIEINNIGVLPGFRRKSVGKMLLETLIGFLDFYRSVSIFLEVRNTNKEAIEFYTKQQFTEIGRRKNFYSNPVEDALLMMRRIENS